MRTNQTLHPQLKRNYLVSYQALTSQEILKKFNYIIVFTKYYIYSSKMHNQAIYLSVFANKVLFKYRIENFDYLLRKNAQRKSGMPYMKLSGHRREKF